MVHDAVILAGGKGTRLRQRLGDLPKPLIDVAGIPLLERQINFLRRYNIRRILYLLIIKQKKLRPFALSL